MKTIPLILGGVVLAIVLVGGVLLLAEPQRQSGPTPETPSRLSTASTSSSALAFATPHVATPVIGTPTATPALITANTPTSITITVQITGATPLPGGVNLLQLGATGTQPTILGVMQNTGNGMYSLQIVFNETATNQLQLQVSAAFQGLLRRVLSPVLSLQVWGVVSDLGEGFSIRYPPGLYVVSSDFPGQHLIESSPIDIDLGGGAPPEGSSTGSSGFAIAINSVPYTSSFTITQYLADIHPDDPLGTVTPVIVAGVSAYTVVFTDEVGAGEPITIIPRNGSVLEISYSSTFGLGTPQDLTGLTVYNSLLNTLTLY